MDFMKVFNQAVREIQREVNLRVFKVPEFEQKVIDATNDELWGPHGTALQEIAQATKNLTECPIIMDVLWTRLRDTGSNWRRVYKALTVIEYLVANGSERALDEIFEHTYQISALSGFEHVEPNGKDVGFNVRRKVEIIMSLIDDNEKLKVVREKAASNRDKYIGLSSKGISSNSYSASFGGNSYSNNHYGSFSSSREGESFRDSYKEGDQYENKNTPKSHDTSSEHAQSKSKIGAAYNARDKKSQASSSSKQLNNSRVSPNSSGAQPSNVDDDLDDFDPRGSSSSVSPNPSSNQLDLFGESLMSDLLDAPSVATKSSAGGAIAVVDSFADANFQSAAPQGEPAGGSNTQVLHNVDLFAGQPAFSSISSNMEFFSAPDTSIPSVKATPSSEPTNTGIFDPFASIPLHSFDGSDTFGAFTSHNEPLITEPSQDSTDKSHKNLYGTSTAVPDIGVFTSHTVQMTSGFHQQSSIDLNPKPLAASNLAAQKDTFQVKSGIWADSLSRGLIDLNISASKKADLANIGIVGGLDNATKEKEKGTLPSFYMGRAMGTGSDLGRSGFSSSRATESVATFVEQQFGNYK